MVVESGRVIARMGGSADADAFQELATFIDQVEQEVGKSSVDRVVADLRELEFATSSCLKVLATWLMTVAERPHRYHIEFLSNPEHRWQRRSLNALSACAPELVEVRAS
jgi:hypothetical protein